MRPRLWIPLLPFILAFFGFVSNEVCIRANHGVMPVEQAQCSMIQDDDAIHGCMTAKTRLKALADIFPTDGGTMSVGDVAMDQGAGLVIPVFLLWGVWLGIKIHRGENR